MKKKIISYAITCVVIAVLTILAIIFGGDKEVTKKQIDAYRFDSDMNTDIQTISNGKVSLEFNPKTTQFVYTDANGNKWTGYPEAAESGSQAVLKSLIYLQYKNSNGQKYFLSSFEHSVAKENYTYEVLADQNAIRIDFTIGLISKTYVIPAAMPEARFEEFKAKNTEEGAKHMRDWYSKYDAKRLIKDKDKWAKLSEKYPDLTVDSDGDGNPDGIVYEIFSNLQNYQKEALEREFEAMGYTREDYEADMEYGSHEDESDIKPTINLSLYLKLEDDTLVAEVPYESMEFYSEYPLTGLRILPFMCAAGKDEEGFLFVPDGSGAKINFNNGKIASSTYSARVYGWDYAQARKEIVSDPIARFPVYGISYTDRNASLLCLIEEGEAYATIEADISGKSHDFNYVSNDFLIVHNDLANISGRSLQDIYIYESKIPKDEKLRIRVKSIDSANYVDMAKAYQQYLAGIYPELGQKVTKTDLPTAVELVGSIIKTQHILGFPKDLPYALTTYDEMGDIMKDLHDAGWSGVNVVLNGWFNRGVVHDWPDDIDLIRKLGSKKTFKGLVSDLEGYGYSVAGKADFQFVHHNKLFDSFVAKSDAARLLNREPVKIYPYSSIWYGEVKEEDPFFLAKPSYTEKALSSFIKDADKLGLKNIAFNSIGNKLGADYHPRKGISRQANMNLQVKQISALASRENVFYNSNMYVVPYADLLIDFPIHAQGTSLEDESIPFFPIALHGYVRYTGDSINISNDYITNLLNSAETGAGLYFIFMEATGDELQESDFTYFFGANYDSWKDSAKTLYNRYKADFGPLTTETITDHKQIAENVYMTEFSNGTKVYVNYRTLDYKANGLTIPAQDWVIETGKGGN